MNYKDIIALFEVVLVHTFYNSNILVLKTGCRGNALVTCNGDGNSNCVDIMNIV